MRLIIAVARKFIELRLHSIRISTKEIISLFKDLSILEDELHSDSIHGTRLIVSGKEEIVAF